METKSKSTGASTKPVKKSAPTKSVTKKVAGGEKGAKAAKKSTKQAKAGTVFSLKAPEAREVCVAGSFNDWALVPLSSDPAGTWTCSMDLDAGEYEYRFFVDGVWWDDPMNEMRRGNEFGTQNCVLNVCD